MVHKLSNMFKCPLCQFEHKYEDYIIFKEHYKLKHPFVATKYITVFEKVSVHFKFIFINIKCLQ